MSYEVDPRRNMVDIHEESFSPETLAESIVQPTGRGARILSAVINENHLTNPPLFDPTIARKETDYHQWLPDEVQHAGVLYWPMDERLLLADLVVDDVP